MNPNFWSISRKHPLNSIKLWKSFQIIVRPRPTRGRPQAHRHRRLLHARLHPRPLRLRPRLRRLPLLRAAPPHHPARIIMPCSTSATAHQRARRHFERPRCRFRAHRRRPGRLSPASSSRSWLCIVPLMARPRSARPDARCGRPRSSLTFSPCVGRVGPGRAGPQYTVLLVVVLVTQVSERQRETQREIE